MANWWDSLVAPFAPAPVSGYDFGTPCPAGGWAGEGTCYGWPVHLGSDIGTPAGETIVAPGAGVATFQSGLTGYGNLLSEKLASGYTFEFGHVASGISGAVAQGQPIGKTGANIGSSKGAVTLVQVLTPQGQSINPDPILSQLGTVAGNISGGVSSAAQSLDPLSGIGNAINQLPAQAGAAVGTFFQTAAGDVGQWLKSQAVAAFVAAIVLIALFML